MVGVPKMVAQIGDWPPWNLRTMLGFPVIGHMTRRLTQYLEESLERRSRYRVTKHVVEGFAKQE